MLRVITLRPRRNRTSLPEMHPKAPVVESLNNAVDAQCHFQNFLTELNFFRGME